MAEARCEQLDSRTRLVEKAQRNDAKGLPFAVLQRCARQDSNLRPLPPQGRPVVGRRWRGMAERGSTCSLARLLACASARSRAPVFVESGHFSDILLPLSSTKPREIRATRVKTCRMSDATRARCSPAPELARTYGVTDADRTQPDRAANIVSTPPVASRRRHLPAASLARPVNADVGSRPRQCVGRAPSPRRGPGGPGARP